MREEGREEGREAVAGDQLCFGFGLYPGGGVRARARSGSSACRSLESGRGGGQAAAGWVSVRPTMTTTTRTDIGERSDVLLVDEAVSSLRPVFQDVDKLVETNLRRVLDAYREHRVGRHHFSGNNGYGHGDEGRDVLDSVFATIFGCEAALVRVQFFSGTHAITAALFAGLRPGDELLSVTGPPYDTLEEVIGIRGSEPGSLKHFGISYREHPLLPDGSPDIGGISAAIRPDTEMVLIQRSCGYSWRPTLGIAAVKKVVDAVKRVNPEIICFVDNCFGEFAEPLEPTHVGADLVAGSLIKNCGTSTPKGGRLIIAIRSAEQYTIVSSHVPFPDCTFRLAFGEDIVHGGGNPNGSAGGTLASSGGYVAGRRDLVKAAANRLSAPGVAGGASLGHNRELFQGLFLAPQIVGEAIKGSHLVAEVMTRLGYEVNPAANMRRSDIIQAVKLGSREKVLAFCRCVQTYSPIGSYIVPTAGQTPGYGDEVVFADGNFVDGSTLELSADGPLREPFVVFAQGGTHWTHWAIVLREIVREIGPSA